MCTMFPPSMSNTRGQFWLTRTIWLVQYYHANVLPLSYIHDTLGLYTQQLPWVY